MLSGVGARAHGLWWNSYQADRGYIHVPTIFSVAHESGLSTAMFVGKPKLRHIAIPGTVDHFERPSYLCGGVAKRAGAYFAANKPDLMFVHFSDPDEYGHSHGWMSKEYLRAVHTAIAAWPPCSSAIDASGLADTHARDRHRRSRRPRQEHSGGQLGGRSRHPVDRARSRSEPIACSTRRSRP